MEVIYCRPDCTLSLTWVFFSNPQWNFMCYYTKVYINIIPTIHKKYRKQNKQPTKKLVSQIILEINSLTMWTHRTFLFLVVPLLFLIFFCFNNKCGHRNMLSKRLVWMSIFHIINFKKKFVDAVVLDFLIKS